MPRDGQKLGLEVKMVGTACDSQLAGLQIHRAIRQKLFDFPYDFLVKSIVTPGLVEAAVHLGSSEDGPPQWPVVSSPGLQP